MPFETTERKRFLPWDELSLKAIIDKLPLLFHNTEQYMELEDKADMLLRGL